MSFFIVPDLSKPYRELGNQPKGQADFIEQNGVIYGWSDSNVQYEFAWWHSPSADPNSPLVRKLREERPLPEGVVFKEIK